jgi:dTDP-4-dehydrorhamnose 3,5-epimerase
MIFIDTPIAGAMLIEPTLIADERGCFGRTFCAEEFAARGLDPRVSQCNTSVNPRAGTLRGLHYQHAPHGEAKLVRCTRGAVYDVVVDLRLDSPTYLRWFAAQLSAENRHAFFIPDGCAHGFQTLENDSEVLYQMSTPYVPGSGRGARWDDPALGVTWPDPPVGGRIMSDRDAGYPDLDP